MKLYSLNDIDIYTTGGGEIDISTSGSNGVDISTSGSGKVDISSSGGGVDISTSSSGKVDISSSGGGVDISTSGSAKVEITSSGGGIDIIDTNNNDILIKSTNGGVNMMVADDKDLTLSNIAGDTYLKIKPSTTPALEKIEIFNNSGTDQEAILIDSENGGITLKASNGQEISLQDAPVSITNADPSNDPDSGALTVNGGVGIAQNLYVGGTLDVSGTSYSSDDRLKHNEQLIENGLEVIRQLQPQKYQKTTVLYDPDYQGPVTDPYQIESGLIAQDILQIPEINYTVSGGDYFKDDQKISKAYSVKYNDLFVYNIAATKELDLKNKHLQAQIDELKYQLQLSNNLNNNIFNSFNLANQNYQTIIKYISPIIEENKKLAKKVKLLTNKVEWCENYITKTN